MPASRADFDRLSNSLFALRLCANQNEFDCIENISVIYPNGLPGKMNQLVAPKGSSLDEYGQINENFNSDWSYSDANGITRRVTINANLTGEKYISPTYKKLYPAFWIWFWNLDKSEVTSGIKFKISLKTSWLRPQGVALGAANASFTEEKVQDGNRYVFLVSPYLSTSLDSPEKFQEINSEVQDNTQSSREFAQIALVIDHFSSLPGGSFVDTTCSPYGYIVTSRNSLTGGEPYMSDAETLKFNMGAPHRLSSGLLNTGFFAADIHIAYLDCRFPGNTLTKSPRVEISVINTDGTAQVISSSVIIEKGILKVRVSGFHYSSPTLVLKASDNLNLPILYTEVVEPKKLVTTKKMTITCIKGKVIKKFTSGNPKCPTGYKKK